MSKLALVSRVPVSYLLLDVLGNVLGHGLTRHPGCADEREAGRETRGEMYLFDAELLHS